MVTILIGGDSRYPFNRKIIRKAVLDSFTKHKIRDLDCEVSIFVVGSRKMNELTKKYLGDAGKHEVLSFALEEISQDIQSGFVNLPDNILRLGDVVLCWPLILEKASQKDVMVDEEVYEITSHAVEHLLGKHHE